MEDVKTNLEIWSKTIEQDRYGNPVTINQITYDTPEKFQEAWGKIDPEIKRKMAESYKESFEGPPWFEVGWYEVDKLIEEDLPSAFSKFTPGYLAYATNEKDEVMGVITGGLTDFEDLIRYKYANQDPDAIILEAKIGLANAGIAVPEKFKVFYENEAYVSPEYQGNGIGEILGRKRVELAKEWSEIICGRTVNEPWINMKKRLYAKAGFSKFVGLQPVGDSYRVEVPANAPQDYKNKYNGKSRTLFFGIAA